jgi:predicted DNA-binding transcriptional regulator AlpA
MSANQNPLRLVSAVRLALALDVSRRSIERWMNDPGSEFPRPIKLGRRNFFHRAAVERWLCQREGGEALKL